MKKLLLALFTLISLQPLMAMEAVINSQTRSTNQGSKLTFGKLVNEKVLGTILALKRKLPAIDSETDPYPVLANELVLNILKQYLLDPSIAQDERINIALEFILDPAYKKHVRALKKLLYTFATAWDIFGFAFTYDYHLDLKFVDELEKRAIKEFLKICSDENEIAFNENEINENEILADEHEYHECSGENDESDYENYQEYKSRQGKKIHKSFFKNIYPLLKERISREFDIASMDDIAKIFQSDHNTSTYLKNCTNEIETFCELMADYLFLSDKEHPLNEIEFRIDNPYQLFIYYSLYFKKYFDSKHKQEILEAISNERNWLIHKKIITRLIENGTLTVLNMDQKKTKYPRKPLGLSHCAASAHASPAVNTQSEPYLLYEKLYSPTMKQYLEMQSLFSSCHDCDRPRAKIKRAVKAVWNKFRRKR